MTTIRDVAKAAGVSTATVSAVINDSAYVSPDLRARVLKAINELRYAPSQVARNLKRGRTQLIALAVADLANPFYARIVWAAEAAAAAWGYALVVFNSDENSDTEKRVIDRIRALGCDGAVLVPVAAAEDYRPGKLREGAPVVLLGRSVDDPAIDTVTIDNRSAGSQATNYLLDLGHTRIGSITGPLQISTGRGRLDGMIEAMEARGLAPLPAAYPLRRISRGCRLLRRPRSPPPAGPAERALRRQRRHGAGRDARHCRSRPALSGRHLGRLDRQHRRHRRHQAAAHAHRASGAGHDQRGVSACSSIASRAYHTTPAAMSSSSRRWLSATAAPRYDLPDRSALRVYLIGCLWH